MSSVRLVVALLTSGAMAPIAFAQGPIRFQTLDRTAEVDAETSFDDQPDDCSQTNEDQTIDSFAQDGFFAFDERATASGAGASVQADALVGSTARADRIDFAADFSVGGSLGNACRVAGGAAGSVNATFTVTREVQAALTGSVELDPLGGPFDPVSPTAQVILTGFSPTGGLLSINVLVGGVAGTTEADIFEPVTLYPDATYAITIGGGVPIGFDEGVSTTTSATGTLKMNVVLALGDNDEDGLLDVWETFGIDVDEDGAPELDLPALGADPDRKDLFVEIDVMSNASIDPGALDDVRDAFANAPGHLVSNPDGSTGITFHAIVDETNLPPTTYAARPNFWSSFQALKEQYYGTPVERNSPKWDFIRAARSVSSRYCIWGGTRQGDTAAGVGEIKGDDSVLLSGRLSNGGTRNEQAGIFMHEFGHNLGLKHGGGDNINRKINYVSIMNYALTIPYSRFPQEVRDTWRLDFSQRVLPDVDESNISEVDGFGAFDAPEILDRFGFVSVPDLNAPPPANPDDPPKRKTITVPLDETSVDLNEDGDVNDSGIVDTNNDGAATVLKSFNDWSAIHIPLFGSENFGFGNFGTGEDSDELPGGTLSIDLFDEIADELADTGPTPCNIADLVEPFGVTDLDDIDALIPLFIAGDPAADFVPPQGIVDLDDLDAFIVAFLAGCP